MIWMFTISPPVLLMYIQKFTMQLKQTKFQLLPWQRTVCSLLPGYNRQVGQWIQLRQFVVTPIKFLRSQILITYFRCEIHRPYLFVGHSTSIHQISVKGESSRYWAIRSQPLSFTICIVSIINFPSLLLGSFKRKLLGEYYNINVRCVFSGLLLFCNYHNFKKSDSRWHCLRGGNLRMACEYARKIPPTIRQFGQSHWLTTSVKLGCLLSVGSK